MVLTILVFIVMLSVLVLIHELGHFLVAKKFGIKVEEFGFGFPPRVWGKKIGETLYSINLLPIGGFVKLFGEDEAGSGRIKPSVVSSQKSEVDEIHRAFFARPIWQRALVVIAGVVMNFLLAVLIITYLFTFEGVPTPGNQIVISEVVKSSPADLSGLKKNDLVLKINNIDIHNTNALILETRKRLGEKINIQVRRGNEVKTIWVVPRKDYPKNQGPMGIAISQNIEVRKYPFPQSLYYGTYQALNDSYLTVAGFKNVIIDIFTRFTVPAGVAGPIGMAQLTGEFVKAGPLAVLSLMYVLSLSLAVLNILPIPALDGGRFFFILVEAVTRRKVNPRFEATAHAVGIALLLTFMALVSYKDIIRIISGQSIFPQ
ncbi:MAG: hypothetical protein US51_C0003G0017 [Microgenomates group bacterium GW2011_GWA2_37_6]|nr:MAG: hypothetical protein US51_C0003G0017 [Microgenomates group bacterium GW2011_GWA2_37_6]